MATSSRVPAIAPTKRVLAIVLAGGKGERLHPLTHERSKPAVPFGGKYRIVDFVLSNFVNSGVQSIYVLVQYMSQSLIEYLRSNWRTAGLTSEQFITVVPPQMRLGTMWYRGTADAVRQNLNLIHDFDPDIVAVFGADHVYRMDVGQMIQYHVERGADATIATIPVPLKSASSFGILETDAKGRVIGFVEKPPEPKHMPGDTHRALASMGNYLFNKDLLVELLKDTHKGESDLDFGKNILPLLHKSRKLYAYDFSTNVLPGIKPYEEQPYWRDVGTIASFYDANMDILGARPKLNLNNRRWFIHSGRYGGPPAKILDGKLTNCIIGDGCFIRNATIKNSILGRGVHVHDGAVIEDSIIMDFSKVRADAHIKRTIVDRFNEIPAKTKIGSSREDDAKRYFVDPAGIVVVPRGETVPR
ncbi:MAG: glucose-1-phosphate adenylyltransferase [Elusimicrobia bacterium RBG_16_66_12]|nr:MAG: glucose-1-phosphate adenylyltransferase [Elusimicrobia bacterium RBG_16_66_12]